MLSIDKINMIARHHLCMLYCAHFTVYLVYWTESKCKIDCIRKKLQWACAMGTLRHQTCSSWFPHSSLSRGDHHDMLNARDWPLPWETSPRSICTFRWGAQTPQQWRSLPSPSHAGGYILFWNFFFRWIRMYTVLWQRQAALRTGWRTWRSGQRNDL